MTTLSIRLPRSVHTAVKIMAARDEISMNQFISSAVAEKVASLEAENYLTERGKLGSREAYLRVLDKVPD